MRLISGFFCLVCAAWSQTPRLETANIGDFRLESGETLKECKITSRTWGRMNAERSNIVLFPSFFNGNTADLAIVATPRIFVATIHRTGVLISAPASSSEPPKRQPKDQALSPVTAIEFAKSRRWVVIELDSPSGHAAFKGEAARIGEAIRPQREGSNPTVAGPDKGA